MKLLRCEIENFGCLCGKETVFSDGLNVINEPNGYGKTTLAAFIESMFYGLPAGGRDAEKNARKKYAPWQGGAFGGLLEFESNGKQYRITRRFDEKSSTKDTFALYLLPSLTPCDDYSENIGQELFGLSQQSFMRSTYVPQRRARLDGCGSDMLARLGNLVEGTDGANNYESAKKRLEDARRRLEHYKGGKGEIPELADKKSILRLERADALKARENLLSALDEKETLQKNIAKLENEDARLRREIAEAAKAAAAAALWDSREEKRNSIDKLKERMSVLLSDYPAGLPDDGELKKAAETLDALEASRAEAKRDEAMFFASGIKETAEKFPDGVPDNSLISEYEKKCLESARAFAAAQEKKLTENETADIEALEGFFSCGDASGEFLDKCAALENNAARLDERSAEKRLTDKETAEKERLFAIFGGEDATALIDCHRRALREIDELRSENAELRTHTEIPKPKIGAGVIFPLAAGVLLAAAGAALLIFGKTAAGCICLFSGLAALFAAGFVYLGAKTAAGASPVITAEASEKIEKNNEKISHAENGAREYIKALGFSCGGSLLYALDDIEKEYRKKRELDDRERRFEEERDELEREKMRCKTELSKMLKIYFDDVSRPRELIDALREDMRRLAWLRERRAICEKERSELEKTAKSLSDEVTGFAKKHLGYTPETAAKGLERLKNDITEHEKAKKELSKYESRRRETEKRIRTLSEETEQFFTLYAPSAARERESITKIERTRALTCDLGARLEAAQRELADFEAAHKNELTAARPQDGEKLLSQLEQKQKTVNDELAENRKTLAENEIKVTSFRAKAERLSDIEDEISNIDTLYGDKCRNRDLLDKTAALLESAREKLSQSCTVPVEKSFREYLSLVSRESAEDYRVDGGLSVTKEAMGHPRSLTYLSEGIGDIVSICMRLSLSDTLWKSGDMFIILDDPFINLDDEHTEKSLALLKKLSETRQIIYLVCHSSRAG